MPSLSLGNSACDGSYPIHRTGLLLRHGTGTRESTQRHLRAFLALQRSPPDQQRSPQEPEKRRKHDRALIQAQIPVREIRVPTTEWITSYYLDETRLDNHHQICRLPTTSRARFRSHPSTTARKMPRPWPGCRVRSPDRNSDRSIALMRKSSASASSPSSGPTRVEPARDHHAGRVTRLAQILCKLVALMHGITTLSH